ncbi:MAG: bifunctional glycosyltransferase/class I SAM-dependent methyltransferase [Myxococcales bacterium]|nr:bifunctional glycosyltransferase/class I SAM-dependent methyltransferase [Myxococcales bacterium]
MDAKPRLLIFVIAYYADRTLKEVLERIPAPLFDEYDCEVLVVDDASEDRTFAIGREYQAAHPDIRMTVLRNEYNQGYGGNQKVGYAYAIAAGFDLVAMVHGDGQYAPEELPRLTAPLRDGRADAVMGSRMLERFAALRGRMPMYKYVGNKILTAIQNRLLGTSLSEFHSGYRVYSVAMLKRLPFRLNSDDFHFDTEIIIQLLNAGARIVELPIPTYYGSEISRVNGVKYAKDVIVATAANAFHRANLLYQRRFDTAPKDNTHYDLKLGYPSSHSYALEAVPAGASVLDIGSGPAGIASELAKKGCETAVVDQFPPPPGLGGMRVFVQNLDDELRFDARAYRYLLLLDIIEHLREPEQFLDRLRAQFDHEPRRLVMTTPNIAFIVQRVMLLFGQFNYGRQGILDRTHTRLLTFRAARQMLADAGFRVRRVRGVPAPFPKVLGDGWLGRAAIAANLALIRMSKTLFSYQIYIEADGTPDVDSVLRDTLAKSALRA